MATLAIKNWRASTKQSNGSRKPSAWGRAGTRITTMPDEIEHYTPKPPLLNHSMPIVPQTPLEMLGRAVQMGADVATIERLCVVAERFRAETNKEAYDEAMAAAAAELPAVVRDRTVSHGTGKASYKHKSLAAIEKAVRPVLSKHGLH